MNIPNIKYIILSIIGLIIVFVFFYLNLRITISESERDKALAQVEMYKSQIDDQNSAIIKFKSEIKEKEITMKKNESIARNKIKEAEAEAQQVMNDNISGDLNDYAIEQAMVISGNK